LGTNFSQTDILIYDNSEKGDVKLDKDSFYDDMRERLRLFYPEKTDDGINKMIDKSYARFENIIEGM
jgi:hypothetical protein